MITALPTPPSTNDPANFATKADALLAALPAFVTETNAVAVAMNLNSTTDTSASSVAIGTGAKSFTVSAGKSFQPGMWLVIADTAAPSTNQMIGTITSYNAATGALVMSITAVLGSGTKTAWSISQSSSGGAVAGPLSTSGITGAAASGANSDITSTSALAEMTNVATINGANVAFVPVRQTVLSGPVDSSGFSAFGGSTGSTTVTASGTLIATAANGFVAAGQQNRIGSKLNPSWPGLSTNGVMFKYFDVNADGTLAEGVGTLAPVYQHGGTPSVTNGQFTFNTQEMKGYVGNGATAVQTYRVYVGQVTVAGGVVTAITWYALQGRYDSGLFAVTTSTVYSKNHNLGVIPKSVLVFVADDTAGTNEVVMIGHTQISTNAFGAYPSAALTRTSMQYTTAAVGVTLNTSGGALASGAYRYIVGRGW